MRKTLKNAVCLAEPSPEVIDAALERIAEEENSP